MCIALMIMQSTKARQQYRSSKTSKVLSESVNSHAALAGTCQLTLAPRASVGEKQSRHLSCSAQGLPLMPSLHVRCAHFKRRLKGDNISQEHHVEVSVRVRVRFQVVSV